MIAKSEAVKILEQIKQQVSTLHEETVGWFKVNYPHGYESMDHSRAIEMWVCDHCGNYRKMGTTYYFQEEEDASYFLLRWG